MSPARRVAFGLAVISVFGLAPQLRGEADIGERVDCSGAVMIDGELACAEQVPRSLEQLCLQRGLVAPRSDVRLHPGDAVEVVASCLSGAPVGRMSPGDLIALALPVNVNEASLAELDSLPGVGPKTAERIVAGRPFAAHDDLVRVRGIGPKRLAALRARARVSW